MIMMMMTIMWVLPLILSFSRKYYLIQQGKAWSDAQAYCRATYNDLAIIKSGVWKSQVPQFVHRFVGKDSVEHRAEINKE
ncbi:hypothetical protein QTP70_020812 [Hemibagrus guttatus]|uniref:C-type lectin domain-containing protein n=1 Tax=Hemibagrus guttatus TaxID=175788 RepID=A0AAE0RHU0_9TELE|nr:hypothetical protein QTP70_020812 [Hemibagrus guttatus]